MIIYGPFNVKHWIGIYAQTSHWQVRSEIAIDDDEDFDVVKKIKSKQKGDQDSDEEVENMEFKTRIGMNSTSSLTKENIDYHVKYNQCTKN